jgi:hypothetical protein
MIYTEKIQEYFSNPVSVLSAQFDNTWKKKEEAILNDVEMIYKETTAAVQDLAEWITTTHTFLVRANMSNVNQIFNAPAGVDAHLSLMAKEKAAVKLLTQLLSGELVSNKYDIEGVKLSLNSPESIHKEAPLDTLPLQTLLSNIKTVNKISNLQGFVSQLSTNLHTLLSGLQNKVPTVRELDYKIMLMNVRAKVIGCTELCPCCKRCCDVDHTKQSTIGVGKPGNKHACTQGHQYRGMTGFSLNNGSASLKVCSNIRDVEKVALDGQYYTWRDFKLKFAAWEFELPVDATEQVISDMQNKMLHTWKRIGPTLCTLYVPLLVYHNLLCL